MLRSRHYVFEVMVCWGITAVIGWRIIKDICWWAGFFKWQSFSNILLWEGFAVFIGFHCCVCFLAFVYRRIFPQLSLVFIYLNLQLFFYLLFLIKGLVFPDFADQGWWFCILAVLFVLGLTGPKKDAQVPVYSGQWPVFAKVLAAVWLLSSLCLWIPDNWDANRKVFMDEGFFWANAGAQMIKFGVHEAHRFYYPAGALHPFGIPFMASAPMTWSGWKDPWAVYCWPLVVIFSLGLWLCSQRVGKWALLFFVSALLVVFGNEYWAAQLMYELVYGESFCVILMLVLFSEIWRCAHKPGLSSSTVLVVSGAVGLLSLTKSPLDMFVVPMELTFLFLLFRLQRPIVNGRLLLGSAGMSLLPFLIWSLYDHRYHILAAGMPWHFLEMLKRIPHPNTGLVALALKSMWGLDQNMVYVICLSLLLIVPARSALRILMVPVLLWIAAWFFYYAYMYNYPDGRGDYLSGFRYMLPVVLVLYWAAACSYQEGIERLWENNKAWAHVLQGLSVVFLVMLVFFRKCFLI